MTSAIRSEAEEWERQQRLTTKEQREARREQQREASREYWRKHYEGRYERQ